MFVCRSLSALLFISLVQAASPNFGYETIQLTDDDVRSFPSVAFGDAAAPTASYSGPRCKVEPGDLGWPTDDEWTAFNKSLGFKLLKPVPVQSVCYPGPGYDKDRCDFLSGPASHTRFYSDDPLTVLTQWNQGNTCLASLKPTGNCTQGGFPVYVVNATTVKDIQLAANFARNKNLRLIIK
jgi:hypothetical protein